MYERGEIVLVCPEVLGGLDTPRCPCEIVGGDGGDVLCGTARVLSRDGGDMTQPYVDGAKKTLEIARQCGARRAYLKSRSPSCGYGCIYDGTFSGKLKAGAGVAAQLLKQNGIEVIEI
jgi:uncharacterized protein YbbK (DUF523 family)